MAELIVLQVEYAAWYDDFREALQGSPIVGTLGAITDLDLEELALSERLAAMDETDPIISGGPAITASHQLETLDGLIT